MIAKITGTLDCATLSEVVVDVNGVGYEIAIPLNTYDKLPRPGQKVALHTHLNVREDGMTLYGFSGVVERDLFRVLIGTTGIGPKTALNILSSMAADSFCSLVVAADIKGLSRINGIGKKSAERLVVELRDKLKTFAPQAALAGGGGADPGDQEAEAAILALVQLGFRPDSARKAVLAACGQFKDGERSSENLIRLALQTLNT